MRAEDSGSRALPHGSRKWVLTCTLVLRPGGQGAPVETILTVLAVGACGVVQAAQAVARTRITVADSIEIHIPAALALAAGLGGSRESQRIPKKAIFAALTAPSCVWKGQVWSSGSQGAVNLSFFWEAE